MKWKVSLQSAASPVLSLLGEHVQSRNPGKELRSAEKGAYWFEFVISGNKKEELDRRYSVLSWQCLPCRAMLTLWSENIMSLRLFKCIWAPLKQNDEITDVRGLAGDWRHIYSEAIIKDQSGSETEVEFAAISKDEPVSTVRQQVSDRRLSVGPPPRLWPRRMQL